VTATAAKKPRDPRLDFFRGVSLLAIFFAHVPGGWAREFIWARFGLSDAAHVFVFISGFAAAIAFGGSFAKFGFATGSARIAWRVCQLYACHLALFFLALFLVAAFGLDYAVYLGIDGFFADPATRLVELFTLRYVPTYFDILPLYMLVLASVPLVMALARIHPGLVIALSVASWSFVQATGFNLPAGEGRSWGFNPFAWQLIFLAGFAFSRGWIQAPKPTPILLAVCFGYLAFGAIAEVPWVWTLHPDLDAVHEWAYAHAHKPNLDLRQFAHFLALAFVALWFVRDRLHWLTSPWGMPFVRLGRQALPVFFAGMALSHLGGIAMGALGTGLEIQIVVHVLGVGGLFAAAGIARYVKNAPWKTGVKPPPSATVDATAAPASIIVPSVAR
jgi:hypothetical protein